MPTVDFDKRPMRAIKPVDILLKASAEALDNAGIDGAKLNRLKVTTLMEISVALAEMREYQISGQEDEDRRFKEFKSFLTELSRKQILHMEREYDALHSITRSVNGLGSTEHFWDAKVGEFVKMGSWRAYRFGRGKGWSRRAVLGLILISR